jgi:low affinity Fe/Cu permease
LDVSLGYLSRSVGNSPPLIDFALLRVIITFGILSQGPPVKLFDIIAKKLSEIVGSATMFMVGLMMLFIWFLSGFFFHFSDTWQLIINSTTSIITFLMVFLIQHTQNRDTMSMQIKLDELIRVHRLAHNALIDLDKLSDQQIMGLQEKYRQVSIQLSSENIIEDYLNEVNGPKEKA